MVVSIAIAALAISFLSFAFGVWQYRRNSAAIRREQSDREDQIGYFWASEWARQRPVVYPVLTKGWLNTQAGVAPFEEFLPLKNGGRGPALNVRGAITEAMPNGQMQDHRMASGTIAPGDMVEARLPAPGVRYWSSAAGQLEYTDLAGGSYTVPFVVSNEANGVWEVIVGDTVHTPPRKTRDQADHAREDQSHQAVYPA